MSAVQRKKFTQRNVFYLRASPYVVLQTILYLDYRHVEWMNLNPNILTQVLSILRTRIMPKLRKESDPSGKLSAMSKKERVDVYSDRDFQVAYFFRRMDDRHSVLLKEKSLVFPSDPTLGEVKVEEEGNGNLHAPIPRATPAPARAASVVTGTSVRDGESSAQPMRIKDSPEAQEAITSSPDASMATLSGADDNALFRGAAADEEEEAEAAISMPPPASASTRRTRASSGSAGESSRRSKRVRIQEGVDVKPEPAAASDRGDTVAESEALVQHGGNDNEPEAHEEAIIITEEDEEKMKPKLHVKYAGFRIFGKLLVLVVEPSKRALAAHPELFGEKRATEIRQLSVAPRSMTPGLANNRSGSVQGRFTSLEPAERSSRNASVGRGVTPLFRGATPADSDAGGTPGPLRSTATPAPRGTSVLDSDAVGMIEGQRGDTDDDGPTIGELEGIELATQMLEREEQTMGGNDIEEGD